MQVHIQAQTGTNRHAFPQKFGQKDIHTGSNQKPKNILHTISDWLIQTFTLNIT